MSTTAPGRPGERRLTHVEALLAPWRKVLWVVFLISLILGSVGIGMRITQGHIPSGYGSYVPWGLWVAVYFHGVGIAAGAFAVASVGYLLRIKGFRSRRSLRVAMILVVAAIGPALLAIGLDLGRMSRAWRLLVTPSFTSMLAFNTWTYIVLLSVCAAVWFLSYKPDRGWLKPVLILGSFLAIVVPSQSGAFFGVVDAKPHWNSALLPILLLVSSITAGAAVLLLVRAFVGEETPDERADTLSAQGVLRVVVLASLGVYFVLEFAEFSIGRWNPQSSAPELALILTGPYWWVFWVVHVFLGGVVPAALLFTRRPLAWVGAGGLIGVTFISTRLNVLVPGQAVAELGGLQEAFTHPRLDYVYNATAMEYFVGLFCLALGMAILYAGLRFSKALENRVTQKELPDVSQ